METVLLGLNVTSMNVSAQVCSVCRSVFKSTAAISGSSEMDNNYVRSANRTISVCMPEQISFMYTRNRRGPRIDPVGHQPALSSDQMSVQQEPLFAYAEKDKS